MSISNLILKLLGGLALGFIVFNVTLHYLETTTTKVSHPAPQPAAQVAAAFPPEEPYVAPSSLPKDPYSDAPGTTFSHDLGRAMKSVEYIYFADGCRVFYQVYDAQMLSNAETQPLYQEVMYTGSTIRPDIIVQSYKKAAQVGRDRATSEGCAYWKANPDEVTRMRELARISEMH